MKTLISICGTTGIGKTALSVALARHFKTEIISSDSRQFYKGMRIGTAAPEEEELAAAPHHFIGHLEVTESYSLGQFEMDALKKLENLFNKHPTVIMAGGSMMYEKAVLQGLNDLPEANQYNQELLNKIWVEKGISELQNLLKEKDPEYYSKVDLDNPRRLLRALDIILQTGKTYTENISAQKNTRPFQIFRIGIEAPRQIIYERINSRVDLMMKKGLLAEAEKLRPYKHLPALNTVGYKELFDYFDGKFDLDQAVEEIKKNSRRFAKRQLTWYRKEENIHWVHYQNALQESLSLLQKYNLENN